MPKISEMTGYETNVWTDRFNKIGELISEEMNYGDRVTLASRFSSMADEVEATMPLIENPHEYVDFQTIMTFNTETSKYDESEKPIGTRLQSVRRVIESLRELAMDVQSTKWELALDFIGYNVVDADLLQIPDPVQTS